MVRGAAGTAAVPRAKAGACGAAGLFMISEKEFVEVPVSLARTVMLGRRRQRDRRKVGIRILEECP